MGGRSRRQQVRRVLLPPRNIDFRLRATSAASEAPVNYAITLTFSPTDARVYSEQINGETIDAGPFGNRAYLKNSAASNLAADLGNTQFLRPLPDILRDYSKDRTAYRLGDRGEDFAALINTIVRDDAAHANYTAWLKELTPSELDDVTVLQGAKDDLLFGVKKDGVEYPATVLSERHPSLRRNRGSLLPTRTAAAAHAGRNRGRPSPDPAPTPYGTPQVPSRA